MLFATQTQNAVKAYGFAEGIRLLCEAGYPSLDLSLDVPDLSALPTPDEAKKGKEIGDGYGVLFRQAHAPFGYQKFISKIQPGIDRVFDFAARFGVKQMIVHPLQPGRYYGHEKEIFDLNVTFYKSLIPLIKQYGVKVAIENMWQKNPVSNLIVDDVCADPKELADLYDALDDPDSFTVCLDVGHVALCNREPEDAIRTLGHDRLGALHVHDVDYIDDLHTLPGVGKINWDVVCRALAEVDYTGELTLESDNFLSNFEKEFYPTAVKFMAERARFLAEKVDVYRKK